MNGRLEYANRIDGMTVTVFITIIMEFHYVYYLILTFDDLSDSGMVSLERMVKQTHYDNSKDFLKVFMCILSNLHTVSIDLHNKIVNQMVLFTCGNLSFIEVQ